MVQKKKLDWPAHLQAFRAQHELSQAKLADALKISRRTVEDWEAGRREPIAFLRLALQKIADNLS